MNQSALEKARKAKNILENLMPILDPRECEPEAQWLLECAIERSKSALGFINSMITDFSVTNAEEAAVSYLLEKNDIDAFVNSSDFQQFRKILDNIQQYAEAYHQKKCIECMKDKSNAL